MFVSIFIKNTCFFINLVLLSFLRNNYDCFASCAKEPDDATGYAHVLSHMWPLIVVMIFEIVSLLADDGGRGKSLMDASLILETILLMLYVLLLVVIDFACRIIDNDVPFCKESERCVNSNTIIGLFTIVFYLSPLRKIVDMWESRLRSWAPREYKDDVKRRQRRTAGTTNIKPGLEEQPGTSHDADPDPEEYKAGVDEQPSTSPDADPHPEESTAVGDNEQPRISRETISKRRPIEKRVNLSVER